jgi:serine/threonine protein kinase/Tol biopolymer transport system component
MIGTRLGHYEVRSHLGSGGMGDVYQATDSKLGRDVAVKILPEAFARDETRRARFEREARVLASLNHPHIAALYGLEEFEGRGLLVMELISGETLAERVSFGALPIGEALTIGRQISEALEAAHEKGVVHRDLKPSNIKVTAEGQIKVLDFGLAKALTPETAVDLSNSPTLSLAATNVGVILGTAAYMSPEQARGKEVDRRTDIFAFGCVLYELLTGRRAFHGETAAEVLAAVLKSEPDWSRLPGDTPATVRRLLRRCLEKDPRRRLQSSADLRLEIEEALARPDVESESATRPRGVPVVWLVVALVVVVIALAGALGGLYFREPAETPEFRVDIVTPSTSDPISFAVSPDGRRLTFVASGDGQSRLWLRALDATTAQPILGTDGASYPFWSPDSRSIGFFAEGKLKRVDIGGSPQTLANATLGRGGAWTPDGQIIYAPTGGGVLFRVPASGGTEAPLTKLESGQTSHRHPSMLPDGRRFVFYITGQDERTGVGLGSLDSMETRFLSTSMAKASYMAPGWLLTVQQGTLVAFPFDPSRGEIRGEPITVADPVGYDTISRAAAFSVSTTGLVLYRSSTATRRQLTWFDRSGKALGVVGPSDEDNLADPELSPDGTRVAVDRNPQNNTDVYVLALDGSRWSRLTFDPSQDSLPIWSPDGSRITFRSNRKGVLDLFEKPANPGGNEELVLQTDQYKDPSDWSRDGRFLLFRSSDPKTENDIWVRPADKNQEPFAFLNTRSAEAASKFSPDGRWVAYQSNESGRLEIYVRPFPGPGGQLQVSTSGGTQPRWRQDGKELYYLGADGKLMAVPIIVNGTVVEPGNPEPLFQPRIATTPTSAYRAQYDVAKDGRFLVNVTANDSTTSPITLLMNWTRPVK